MGLGPGGRFPRAYEGREEAVDAGVSPFVLGSGRVRLSVVRVEGEYWAEGVVGKAGGSLADDDDGESRIWFVVVECGGGRPLVRYVVAVDPPGW